MIGYNLYYKGKRINKRELTQEEVDEVYSRSHVYRIEHETKKKIIVPTNQIQIVECTIV